MSDVPRPPDLGHSFTLPPKDAVAYFRSLGYRVTDDWVQTAEAVRARAFAVAKSGSTDILKDIKAGLITAAEAGQSEKQFVDQMMAALSAKGWDGASPGRLKTIFRTNMQSAMMAGRWKQAQETKRSRPYIQYVAVMDAVTRPSHAAMNGLVFHLDDPIWQTHWPPCGYNCRCRVRSLSDRDLKRERLTVLNSDGDRFTETVPFGAGTTQIYGYRTPMRPVRVAQRDSAPGAYPVVERGQTLWWDPEFDPQWVDGEGPPWKLDVRREAMRTDPGFGFNQGAIARWDVNGNKPDVLPDEPKPTGAIRIVGGQRTWKDHGRPDLRRVPSSQRQPAPPLLPAADSADGALEILSRALRVSADEPQRIVQTPIELATIDYGMLPHMVEKRADRRERYALYMLATLAQPFEVYLTEYEDGFRTRYIGLFEGADQLLVVARTNRDGTLVWNFMQGDAKALNRQRVGELLYKRDEKE